MKIDELNRLIESSSEKVYLLDMRGKLSYENGHMQDAILFDSQMEDEDLQKEFPDQNAKYVIYCPYGQRSIEVAERMQDLGYDAESLEGGFGAWLSREVAEKERYERQIILPEIGLSGQRKLMNAKVLIIGAGGLGSPAALYLAGAGVGTIGIVDADKVSLHNLQRQIIHTTENEGVNKAESAKEGIKRLNPHIHVEPYPMFITPENITEIIEQYDFILDGVDNFETKFLINDACVLAKKPFCHAGIQRFEGQVMTYVPGQGPCYRCIFEEIPEKGSIPNCSQAGIIGAVAGMVGCVQAMEAIKYITGIGQLLTGKIYCIDMLTMNGRLAKFPKAMPHCRVCGSEADIRDVRENADDYQIMGCSF